MVLQEPSCIPRFFNSLGIVLADNLLRATELNRKSEIL